LDAVGSNPRWDGDHRLAATEPQSASPPPAAEPGARLPDTFCTYLARQLIAKKGFVPATFPEAAALGGRCDIVLARFDGVSLTIACLVDRDASPDKMFGLSVAEVEAAGKACIRHAARLGNGKMPIGIHIYEVGPAESNQRQRLAAYKRPSWTSKVVPSAWIVDTGSGAVWSNAPFGGVLKGRRFIEKLLRSPRAPEADLQAPEVAVAPPAFPWLTCAILAALAAVFAAELIYGIGASTGLLQPSVATLIAFGGLMRSLVVQSGEWFRLLSAPLLHADATHLLMNGAALFIAGRVLENLVGRAWLALIFVAGALGGALLSLALNPDGVVSVGASGAVTALFAAMLVLAYHFPPSPAQTGLFRAALYVLVPSLLPLLPALSGQKVDYAAHFGGAVAGAVIGFLILKVWRRSEPRPRLRPLAAALGLLGFAAFAYPALPLTQGYPAAVLAGSLIPQAQVPTSDADAKAKSANLVARYPRDPRSHFFRAVALLDQGDSPGAERALRAGLAEEALWRPIFNPELPLRLRTMLAMLVSDGRRDEAKIIAQPVCAAAATTLRTALDEAGLCER
jgi:rhomboid protease GluP